MSHIGPNPQDRPTEYGSKVRYTIAEKDTHDRIVEIRDYENFGKQRPAEQIAGEYNQEESELMLLEHRGRRRTFVVVKATTTYEEV